MLKSFSHLLLIIRSSIKLISVALSCHRKGYDIVMTTSLSSDVPVGYFSWAEYDIMSPVHEKTENALAAAFISNCGARNFRLQALDKLEKLDIKIDSYGACHRNHDGRGTPQKKKLSSILVVLLLSLFNIMR